MAYDFSTILNAAGLPAINVKVGDYMLGLIIDTGATCSVIDKGIPKQLGLEMVNTKENTTMGIDGEKKQQDGILVLDFEFEEQHYTQKFICQPLYNAFSVFQEQNIYIQGLLGSDFLLANRWTIGYKNQTIRL